jgi:predicted membrane metal-binding protein
MKLASVRVAISQRRNYDWLSLVQILSGFMLTALPNIVSGKILGYWVMLIGALQLVLKWYRSQIGLAGGDLEREPPGP